MNDIIGVPQYPWSEGDRLFASALNAAIANGPYHNPYANVINYGADPTGVTDSTTAINAAASTLAPNGQNKAVYLPTGTYRVNGQINLTNGQSMYGDSRGSSVITVDQSFSPSAPAVIFCTAGGNDAGPVIRDLQIAFAQPQTAFTRAGMKTLAAGGTSGSGGTGIMYPWAIAAGDDNFRIQIVRVRVFGAWDGITTNGHNAIYWLDDIEMGALDCGVSLGEGASGVLDFAHINGFHFWNWGFNFSTSPFADGQTIGMRFGNQNGLEARGIGLFVGRMVFTAQAASGWFDITNLALDGDQATLEIASAQWIHISNFYATCASAGNKPQVSVAAGYVAFTNWYSSSASPYPLVNVTGSGYVTILAGTMNWGGGTAISALTVSGGMLKMDDVRLVTNAATPNTVPLIAQSGSGQLQADNLDILGAAGSGGIAIQIANDNAPNIIGKVALGTGWSISVPNANNSAMPYGNLGNYGPVFPAPLDPTSLQTGSTSFGAFAASSHYSVAYGQLALGKVQNAAANNTAFGSLAGYGVTIGQYNTFVGEGAGGGAGPITANNNSCFGALSGNALTSGTGNTLIGAYVDAAELTTGSNNILIGNSLGIAAAGTSNTINIGNVLTATGTNTPATSVTAIAGKAALPAMPASTTYANDAAAAAGGVAVGQLYRNGSVVQVRVA